MRETERDGNIVSLPPHITVILGVTVGVCTSSPTMYAPIDSIADGRQHTA